MLFHPEPIETGALVARNCLQTILQIVTIIAMVATESVRVVDRLALYYFLFISVTENFLFILWTAAFDWGFLPHYVASQLATIAILFGIFKAREWPLLKVCLALRYWLAPPLLVGYLFPVPFSACFPGSVPNGYWSQFYNETCSTPSYDEENLSLRSTLFH